MLHSIDCIYNTTFVNMTYQATGNVADPKLFHRIRIRPVKGGGSGSVTLIRIKIQHSAQNQFKLTLEALFIEYIHIILRQQSNQ